MWSCSAGAIHSTEREARFTSVFTTALQEAGWEETISQLENKSKEVLVLLKMLDSVEGINDDVLAPLLGLWQRLSRGEFGSILVSVTDSLEELGVLAPINHLIAVQVHFLENAYHRVHALLV